MKPPQLPSTDDAPDSAALLVKLASLDLYRLNPFRVLGLPANATDREIRRQVERKKLQITLTQPARQAGDVRPPDPQAELEALREAAQGLDEPLPRLIHELFWVWPNKPDHDKTDEALAAFFRADIATAIALWTEAERDPQDGVATHNLAVLHHSLAMDLELQHSAPTAAGSPSTSELDEHWRQAVARWRRVLIEEPFWSSLDGRIRDLDDPRLTLGAGRRLRAGLPLLLLLVNVRGALQAAEQGHPSAVRRHLSYLQSWEFATDLVQQAWNVAIRPLCERLHLQCQCLDAALARLCEADAVGRRLIEQAAPLLRILDLVLAVDHPIRTEAHDEVAGVIEKCAIVFGNATKQWTSTVGLLSSALSLAGTQSGRQRIEKNLNAARANAEAVRTILKKCRPIQPRLPFDQLTAESDFKWPTQATVDLPKDVFEPIEHARQHGAVGDWEQAILVLETLAPAMEGAQPSPATQCAQQTLAHCLRQRALCAVNTALAKYREAPLLLQPFLSGTRPHSGGPDPVCDACGMCVTRFTPPEWVSFNEQPAQVCSSCGKRISDEERQKLGRLKEALGIGYEQLDLAAELHPDGFGQRKSLEDVDALASHLGVRLPKPRVLRIREGRLSFADLVAAIGDVDYEVRREAVQALAKGADARAVEPLLALLQQDRHPRVREAAAKALGNLGDARVVAGLITVLKDTDSEVRVAVVLALSKLNDASALEPLRNQLRGDGSADVRIEAALALCSLADETVPDWLLRCWKTGDAGAQREVQVVLARLPGTLQARPEAGVILARVLCGYLSGDDSILKPVAAAILGAIGPTAREAVPVLIQTVAEAAPGLREAALLALPKIEPHWRETESARHVAGLMSERVRVWCTQAQAVTQRGDASEAGRLLTGAQQVLGLLERLLPRCDPELDEAKDQLALSLCSLAMHDVSNLNRSKELLDQARAVAATSGVRKHVEHASDDLSVIESRQEVGVLIKILNGNAPLERKSDALQKLCLLGERSALKRLLCCLHTPDPSQCTTPDEIRSQLVRCAQTHPARCRVIVRGLVEILRGDRFSLKPGAAAILGEVGREAEDALPALIELLADVDFELRQAAQQSLPRINSHWIRSPHVTNQAQAIARRIALLCGKTQRDVESDPRRAESAARELDEQAGPLLKILQETLDAGNSTRNKAQDVLALCLQACDSAARTARRDPAAGAGLGRRPKVTAVRDAAGASSDAEPAKPSPPPRKVVSEPPQAPTAPALASPLSPPPPPPVQPGRAGEYELLDRHCRQAGTAAKAAPARADAVAYELWREAQPLLEALQRQFSSTHPRLQTVCDQLAFILLECDVEFRNATENWPVAAHILEWALSVVKGRALRARLEQNLELVRRQIAQNQTCWFCRSRPGDPGAGLKRRRSQPTVVVPRCRACCWAHGLTRAVMLVSFVAGAVAGGLLPQTGIPRSVPWWAVGLLGSAIGFALARALLVLARIKPLSFQGKFPTGGS